MSGDGAARPAFVAGRASPVHALRSPGFRLFFASTTLSNLAQWMQQFAVGWYAVQLAGADGRPTLGAFYLGLTGLARFLPILGFGLVAGVAADRMDRGRLLLLTRSSLGVLSALLAALLFFGHLNLVVLLLLTALLASAFAFDGPARLAITATLVDPRDGLTAISLVRLAMQVAAIVGPLIGAALIGPFGLTGLMVAVAILFGLSGLGVGPLRGMTAPHRAPAASAVEALRASFAYIWADPALRGFVGVHLVMSALGASFGQILPAVAHDTLRVGVVELSWLVAALGVGSVVGASWVMTMGNWRRPGRAMLIAAVVMGGIISAFGFQRDLVPAMALAAACGVVSLVYFGGTGNVLQLLTPNHLQGRVLGIQTTSYVAGIQLGTLVLGTLGSLVGISNAIAGAGVLIALTSALMLRSAPLREAGARR